MRIGRTNLAALATAIVFAATAGSARAAGVADTVTVLPPITIEGDRPLDGERRTTTRARLDRQKIARFAPATGNDALAILPGVDLVKMGPWASRVSLRGLGGDRVLMLVDGVRMNGVRGHGAQASLIPVDHIDAIEVQPGASSAQHGSDAMGGVVQFTTHRSLFSGHNAAQLSLQSRGSDPGDVWGASTRLRFTSPRGGFEITGGAGGLESFHTPDARVPNSGYRERNLSGRFAVQLGATLLDYEHAWSGAYDVGLPAFSDSLGSHGEYPRQGRHLDRIELVGAGEDGMPDARLLASFQSGRSDFEETSVLPRYVNNRLRGYNVVGAEDRVRSRAASVQPSLTWKRLAGLRVGGEFRRETTAGPRSTVTTTTTTTGTVTSVATGEGESMPRAERRVWSASALVAPAWRRLRLELGGRYDRYDSMADSTAVSTTPELASIDDRWSVDGGLSYPIGELEPYVHLATGFRVPNLEERYYHDEIHGGMVVFGNPKLLTERSTASEIGVRGGGLGVLQSMRLSAYRSDVDELITIRYLDMLYGRPQFQYANVKRARIEGVEAQVQVKVKRVILALYGTLPRAVDVATGDPLLDAGTRRATVDLIVPVPKVLPAAQLAMRVRWNDAFTGVGETLARPAFSTTALELSSVWSGVRAAVSVRNLFDHSHREPLSFIDEPGRSVALSLRRDLAIGLPFLTRSNH